MVKGERVRQVRELRGLTQTELAERIGVAQAAIANIENGRLVPSDDLVARLAMALGFPLAFFSEEPVRDFSLGSLLLYRAKASVTAREEGEAYRHAQTVYELATRLGAQFKGVPLRLPRIQEELPEAAANLTRSAFGLSPDAPVHDLIRTIERAGVLVFSIPWCPKGAPIDAFCLWAGVGAPQPVIVVVNTEPGDRVRFTIAHELAHLVMHQSMEGAISDVERDANRFAGALLLPADAMKNELVSPVTLTSLAALKRRWGVSMQAMITRATEIGIINARQKKYLFQQLSMRGWRTREPPALDIPIERPRLLRQMAEVVYGRPGQSIDTERLSLETKLPQQLVEDTLNLHSGVMPLVSAPSTVVDFATAKARYS